VRIWSAETGDQIQSINTGESSVNNLIYLSEDTVEMVGTIDRFLLDIESGSMTSATTVTTTVRANSTTPSGRYSAYTSLLSSQWFIWDNEAWQSRLTIASVPDGVFPTWTAFAPDENSVTVSYTDGTVRLWDLRNPSLTGVFGDGVMAQTMRLSPDGSKAATGHLTGDVVIWDVSTGEELVRIPGADYLITDVAFSPNGEMIAISGHDFYGDGTRTFLSVWDSESGKLLTELDAGEHLHRDDPDYDGLAYGVWGLSFSPAGDYLFSSSAMIFCCPKKAGKLIQWDVSTWEVANILDDGSAGDVYMRLGFIEDDKTIVTTSPYTSVVKTWDFTTGELKDSYVASENSGMHDLVILPDEQRIISPSSFGGPMFLRDLHTGEILNTYVGHHGPIWDAAASPDGTRVIAGDSEGNVLVWDVETGDLLQQFSEPEGAIWGVAYGPDGQAAFSVGEDGLIRQWQVAPLSLDELLEWIDENREVRDLQQIPG
jgi:WD40 repeat protein